MNNEKLSFIKIFNIYIIEHFDNKNKEIMSRECKNKNKKNRKTEIYHL